MNKLNYRCNGNGCAAAFKCRRFLSGPEAKNSPIPFAAFDMRDTVECDGFMPRHSLEEFAIESEGGE